MAKLSPAFMPLSTRGVLAQRVLVSFNVLLSAFCLAAAIVVMWRPCSASRISADPGALRVAKACQTSQLELFMMGFHLGFAVLGLAGAFVAYIGHLVLVRVTRGLLFVFAATYMGLALWQLATTRSSTLASLLGPLELVVAVVTLAVGVPSGLFYERELRCDRRVLPDAFDSVIPSRTTTSISSNSRAIDRHPSRLAW
jgi:hypothetical protein